MCECKPHKYGGGNWELLSQTVDIFNLPILHQRREDSGDGKVKGTFFFMISSVSETVLYVLLAGIWGHKIWYSDLCKHQKLRDAEHPTTMLRLWNAVLKRMRWTKHTLNLEILTSLVRKHTTKPSYSEEAEKGKWRLCQKHWKSYRKGRHGQTYRQPVGV